MAAAADRRDAKEAKNKEGGAVELDARTLSLINRTFVDFTQTNEFLKYPLVINRAKVCTARS